MSNPIIQQEPPKRGADANEVARCARRLAKMHGNNLMRVVAINSGLGMDYADAVSAACESDSDWACLVAEIIPNLSDASGLLDAIASATEAYFEEEDPACN